MVASDGVSLIDDSFNFYIGSVPGRKLKNNTVCIEGRLGRNSTEDFFAQGEYLSLDEAKVAAKEHASFNDFELEDWHSSAGHAGQITAIARQVIKPSLVSVDWSNLRQDLPEVQMQSGVSELIYSDVYLYSWDGFEKLSQSVKYRLEQVIESYGYSIGDHIPCKESMLVELENALDKLGFDSEVLIGERGIDLWALYAKKRTYN